MSVRRLVEFYADGTGRAAILRDSPRSALIARVGLLWNWRAGWVGVHHSARDRRTCVNLIPFLTIWYTRPGGMLP